MRRWWLAIGLLLSVGINVGLLASVATRRAGSRPPEPPDTTELPGPRAPGDPLARVSGLADRLELEGDRRRQFIALHVKLFQDLMRLRAEKAEVQRELRRAVTAGEPDEARIDRLLDESARLNRGLERAAVESVVAVRKVLSAEEQQRYLQHLARLRPGGPGGLLDERPPARPRRPLERLRRWREGPPSGPP